MGHQALTSNAGGTLCPVMVGRDRELAQLQQSWRAGSQMLVVRGRAGIGKSRLTREFANWVRAAGGTVLAGRCSPTAGDVPFRPLREALLAAARVGLAPSARLTAFRPALGSLVPSQEQTREWAEPLLEQLPPIAARNARETGTDLVGYLTENFGFSVFALHDGAVQQTYSADGRGVEFLMGYYPILDRAPKGRDEGDGFQLWIRRHDEYHSQ